MPQQTVDARACVNILHYWYAGYYPLFPLLTRKCIQAVLRINPQHPLPQAAEPDWTTVAAALKNALFARSLLSIDILFQSFDLGRFPPFLPLVFLAPSGTYSAPSLATTHDFSPSMESNTAPVRSVSPPSPSGFLDPSTAENSH